MPKNERAFSARRSGVVITSTIALALGGAAIVAPSSAAAENVRYTDGKTPVAPKASQLNFDPKSSNPLKCGAQLSHGVSSNSGLSYERLVPSEATKTNRNFGLQVTADTSGERTFNFLNVVDGPNNPPISSRTVTLSPLQPGETIGRPATGSVNYVQDVPKMVIDPPARGQTARAFRTEMNLTEGQVNQIANGGMTIGWKGQYNNDWKADYGYFFSDSGEFHVNGVVNPWPSENADCTPITIDWADELDTDNYEATVIQPGETVKVGTVSADNDSLERLRFTAKDPDGNVVPGEITRDGNDIYWTMADYIEGQPAYTQTDKLTFEMIAMPRDLEGLKQAAEENGSLPETVYNSSLTPERYRSPETIATKTFDIDDAKNHDPNYDPRQQNITSGVANNAPTEERQTRTFTNVADSNGDTLAKLVEKYNARIELDDSNVYEGWDAYFRDPENGDYTVVVESPAGTDANPGSFAQPIVKVTYSNGTQDIIPLLVIVDPNNTQTTDVVYPPETVRGLIGEEMASEAPTLRRVIGKNQKPVTPASYAVDPATVPAGWTIEVAPDGTVTATSPSDAKAGDIARPKITATYPDGTVDEREVTFLVGDDASLNDPSYPVEVTKPGAPVTHQIQNAPEGVTFTLDNDEVDGWTYSIDPNTGAVTVTPPADAKGGDKKANTVTVTYPDGTTDVVPVDTVVAYSFAYQAEEHYPEKTGYPGEGITSQLIVDKPAEVDFAPQNPFAIVPGEGFTATGKNNEFGNPTYTVSTQNGEWTVSLDSEGNVISQIPETAKEGDTVTVPVMVTYEDNSTETVPAVITVQDNPTRQVPFGVEYKFDPALAAGTYEVEAKGAAGVEKQQRDGTWKRTAEPKNEVVRVGTKPATASKDVTWTAPIPYSTTTRPNPKLAPGETKVVQQGVDGERTYTAKFTATGDQASVVESEDTKRPIEEIIEYGPRLDDQELVTQTTRKIPFETTIKYDDTLAAGTQVVDKQGVVGKETVTSTQKLVDGKPSGDPVATTTNVTQKQDAVIRVGTKTEGSNTVEHTEPVPYETKVEYDPEMPAGTYEVVMPGKAGEKTVKVTQTIVNSEVTDTQRDEKVTTDPTTEVIKVGTKQATATDKVEWKEPIPFSTVVRPNSDLKPGEVVTVQEGANGEATYTATFTGTNGQATVTESKDRTEPTDKIVEYGPTIADQTLTTTTTNPVPFNTTFVADSRLPAGEQVVDKQGENGVDTVTATQEIKGGKPVGEPKVTTERTKEPVNAVVRVGTKTEGSNTVEHTEPVPYETKVEYDPEMPAGTYEVVTEGKAGEKTVKVTQTLVNSKVTDTQRKEDVTTQPVNEVIKVGTKQATATDKVEWKEPIPFSTVVRPNPDLKPGEVKTVQEGKNGEAKYTATFEGINGQATVTESKDRTEPTDKIVEYGPTIADQTLTSTTTNSVPFNTTFVADPNLPVGEQVVEKQGENGVDTVTATQEIKDGKPVGEPTITTQRTKEPVDAVVRVGTKTEGQTVNSVGAEIPFGVKVEFDPNMPAGTSETVTEGKPGKKTIAVTQKVTNSQPDGEATVEEKITEQPVDQVIKVGTKPSEASAQVTWTASVPFEVETRPNSELKPGEIRVVQEGVPGEKTYTADFAAKGSDAAVTPKEEQTKAPVKEIIEYGPRLEDQELVTTVTKPVPFETEIVFDDSLDSGKQEVKQEGKLGEDTETSTQKLVDGKPSGDPVVETKRTEEPVKQIIRVGTKIEGANTVEHTEPVPYETKVEYDPNLPAGTYEVVTEGKAGEKTVKVTQTIVNSQVTDTKREENVTAQPVTEVIKVGTKQATATDKVEWTEPIPFSTVVRPNPDLKPGEVKTVQEGKNGEAKYTATFEGTNGQATVTESKDRTEPTDKIVEYGPTIDDQTLTSETTRPVEFETEFIFDDTLPAGEQVVKKQGENGEEKITSTQEIKDGKPVGEPTITTEVTKPVKKAIIRVGTKAVTTTATTTEVTTSAVPTTVNTTTTQQVPTTVNTTTTATSTVTPAPATTTVTEKPAPVTETVTVPFTTKTVWDPTLEPGQEVEDVAGVDGKVQVTVADGKSKVETVTNPVQRVVRVGSKPADDVEWTEETPFKVTVVLDAQLEAGKYETVQEGKPGRVIHRADGTEETTAATDHIIKVGTYKVITNPFEFTSVQPFGTTVRPNFKLEPGERKIVQEGKAGLVRYRIDIKTGEVVKLEDSAAVERIVEYGPDDSDDKAVTTVTRPVPFDTEVIEDPNLPEGTQVIAQGEVGEEVVTTVQGLKDGRPFGDPITTAKQTVAPTNAVIRVGTKKPDAPQPLPDFERIVELPFTTKIVWDPTLEPGVEVEDVKGAAGQVKIQVVNGEPTVNTVKEPVQRVVRVGSKPADDVEWTEEIPFQVQVRQNPELTRGESRVVQDGVPGLKRYVNGKGEVVTEPVDYIFEIGTKDLVAELTYSPVTLRPGQTADVEPSTGHVEGNRYRKLEWPEGWEGSVDPDTGKLRVTPPADANPGTKVKLPVEVTDADGNISTVEMEVTVADGGAAPTPTPEDDKASSDTARRCLANAFAANSPFLWLLPLGILGAVGYGVNEAFGPQIQQLNARFDEAVRRNMPDFGVGHGVEKPEFVREIEGQVNAINQRFAPVAEQLQPVGVALGAIALLSLTGVLVAQACSEDGFDNGLTVLGSSKDDNTAEAARSSKK